MYRNAKNGADFDALLSARGFHKRRRQYLRDVGVLDSSSCSGGNQYPSSKMSHDLIQQRQGIRAWDSKHDGFFWGEIRPGLPIFQNPILSPLHEISHRQKVGGPCGSCELSLSLITSEVRANANKGESSSTVEFDHASEEDPSQFRDCINTDVSAFDTVKENDINLDLTISSNY